MRTGDLPSCSLSHLKGAEYAEKCLGTAFASTKSILGWVQSVLDVRLQAEPQSLFVYLADDRDQRDGSVVLRVGDISAWLVDGDSDAAAPPGGGCVQHPVGVEHLAQNFRHSLARLQHVPVNAVPARCFPGFGPFSGLCNVLHLVHNVRLFVSFFVLFSGNVCGFFLLQCFVRFGRRHLFGCLPMQERRTSKVRVAQEGMFSYSLVDDIVLLNFNVLCEVFFRKPIGSSGILFESLIVAMFWNVLQCLFLHV